MKTAKSTIKQHIAVLAFLVLLDISLLFLIPQFGSSRFVAQITLNNFVTKTTAEFSKMLFPVTYVYESFKYNSIEQVIETAKQTPLTYDYIENVTIFENGALVYAFKSPLKNYISFQTIDQNPDFHDKNYARLTYPFALDEEGSLFLPASLFYIDIENKKNYQINFLIQSAYLDDILKDNNFDKSYLLLELNQGQIPIILPLFRNVGNEEAIAVLEAAWSRYLQEDIYFDAFKANHKNYISWFSKLPLATENKVIGFIVPRQSLIAPVNRIISPFTFVILFGSIFYIIFIVILMQKRNQVRNLTVDFFLDQGESESVEFKASLRWDYKENRVNNKVLEAVILKSIAAFSNGYGGSILIGISDEGEVLGLENDYASLKKSGNDFYELHLRTLINSAYGESFCTRFIKIKFLEKDGQSVCLIIIKKGDVPLYTTVNGKEYFYLRCGNSSRTIEKPSELEKYLHERFKKKKFLLDE